MKKSHRHLFIWQSSVDIAVHTLSVTSTFPASQRFVLASQMQRAAISIASNIAEGQGRLTRRDWRNFLGMARGSSYELETHVEIAHRAGLINAETYEYYLRELSKIGAGINRLMSYLERRATEPLSY